MVEKIVTSKTRVKLLNLFLTHIDARYYLREMERMLDESLSPLRRQLLKLVKMGILTVEEEANIKYYHLNKNFEGIEELRNLVLGNGYSAPAPAAVEQVQALPVAQVLPKRVKYDFVVLTLVSIFVLATSIFVLYTSKQLMFEVKPRTFSSSVVRGLTSNSSNAAMPDEMTSKRWKVIPGSVPALSTGKTDGTKKNKEL